MDVFGMAFVLKLLQSESVLHDFVDLMMKSSV